MDAEGAGGAPMEAAPAPGSRFRSLMPSLGTLGDLAEGAGTAYDAYTSGKRAQQVHDRGQNEYGAGAPIRNAGRAALLANARPDLSSTFADPTDPNGRYRRLSVGSRIP